VMRLARRTDCRTLNELRSTVSRGMTVGVATGRPKSFGGRFLAAAMQACRLDLGTVGGHGARARPPHAEDRKSDRVDAHLASTQEALKDLTNAG
jgi:hypothetical protein